MKRKFVAPKPGLKIPDIERRDHLPSNGREVNWSAYWSRLEKEGSITVGQPSTGPAANQKVGGSK